MNSTCVRLRPLRTEDAEPLFHGYLGDADSARFLARNAHESLAQTADFIDRWRDATLEVNHKAVRVVTEPAREAPVGLVTLFRDGHSLEFHFGITRPYRGRGFALALCHDVCDWAQSMPPVKRLWTYPHWQHQAVQRVLERAGFEREGVLRRWCYFPEFGYDDCVSLAKVFD